MSKEFENYEVEIIEVDEADIEEIITVFDEEVENENN